jgi:shikimate kinase
MPTTDDAIQRVVLVGPPGAGKSTVGAALAVRLGLQFADTDALIESVAGMSVSDIFVTEGEIGFRSRERATVVTSLESPGVVSLGGGAILDAETRADLSDERVVFLDVDLAHAASRVGLNRDRPLLLGDVRKQLRALMAERRELYVEVADIVIDTNDREPEVIVDEIVTALATA